MNRFMDNLLIVAYQWDKFREKQYEDQFASLLDSLAKELGTDRQGALEAFMAEIEGEGVAA